jgi:hypothetical protein
MNQEKWKDVVEKFASKKMEEVSEEDRQKML